MRKLAALAAVLLTFAIGAVDVEAKRLGGARSSGMQRQSTQPATPPAQPGTAGAPSAAGAPAQATAAAPATVPTAAATAKRGWAGPLTGLAAGLGLAALASYLGFGEALANVMLIALAAVALLAIVGFVIRRKGAVPLAAGGGAGIGGRSVAGSRIGAALGGIPTTRPTSAAAIPVGFDVVAFASSAKAQFAALQSANDAGDLQRLRDYLAPQMFEVVRDEVQARGGAAQHTEVFGLDAQVIEVADEGGQYIVSVRFTGRVREQAGAVPDDLDEIWHLTKPRTGGGGWVVAGIQLVTLDTQPGSLVDAPYRARHAEGGHG